MNTSASNKNKNQPQEQLTGATFNVVVKKEGEGKMSAMVLGLPEYQVIASDRASAIANLQQLLETSFSGMEIVSLEVELPKSENPWLKIAGKYKDDTQFDEMLVAIDSYRRELDAEVDVR